MLAVRVTLRVTMLLDMMPPLIFACLSPALILAMLLRCHADARFDFLATYLRRHCLPMPCIVAEGGCQVYAMPLMSGCRRRHDTLTAATVPGCFLARYDTRRVCRASFPRFAYAADAADAHFRYAEDDYATPPLLMPCRQRAMLRYAPTYYGLFSCRCAMPDMPCCRDTVCGRHIQRLRRC